MKRLMAFFTIAFAILFLTTANAQRIKIIEGNLSALAGTTSINTEFTYDNMSVGKFDREADYVAKKTDEYNKKEPGRGDNWAKLWVEDRNKRFEPKFNELFEKESGWGISSNGKAKYTFIYHTTFTEPGFNVGAVRKNAMVNAEVTVIETGNPQKVIAKLTVEKALGRTVFGMDFDTGGRIAECYADAGKALGKFFRENSK